MINNNKGATLVEVLAAILISSIVMIYGMGFFISAARRSGESFEFEFALQEGRNRIEYLLSEGLVFGTFTTNNMHMGANGFIGVDTHPVNFARQSVTEMGVLGLPDLASTILVVSWPQALAQPDRRAVLLFTRRYTSFVRL